MGKSTDEQKISQIKSDSKVAKAEGIKIPEYLANGNEDYRLAITAVRRAGYWGIATAALYVLFAVFFAITLISNFSIYMKAQVAPGRMALVIFITVALLVLSIMLRIIMSKLYQLSANPKTIKRYLITNIVICILPVIFGLLMGNIIIPGVISVLTLGFSISALSNFASYEKWFNKYEGVKKKHTSKDIK